MTGKEYPYDNQSLKGLNRYFNSTTVRGRRNTAFATYSVIATAFIVLQMMTRKYGDNSSKGDNAHTPSSTGTSEQSEQEFIRIFQSYPDLTRNGDV